MRTIIPKDAILVPERAVRVFKGQIFDTYQWQEKMFDGTVATFEMLKRPDTIEVLVVEDNKLLVQEQEQPFLGKFWSFAGGRHDHEETELEAARRELKEESGLECASWNLIHMTQPHRKIESFALTYVACRITVRGAQNLDPGEKIINHWMSLEELRVLAGKERFRGNALSLLADCIEADDILKIPTFAT